jgi:hypothetical protein
MNVFDVSNPANPTWVSNVGATDATDVNLIGNTAYISDRYRGLIVADISDPNKVVQQFSLQTTRGARSVAVVNQHAFLTIGDVESPWTGVEVANIKKPESPPSRTWYGCGSDITDLVLRGTTLFVACSQLGFATFDLAGFRIRMSWASWIRRVTGRESPWSTASHT